MRSIYAVCFQAAGIVRFALNQAVSLNNKLLFEQLTVKFLPLKLTLISPFNSVQLSPFDIVGAYTLSV